MTTTDPQLLDVSVTRSAPILMEDADPDRRRFIGGSDMAAIMGLGATYDGEQQTPYTVYRKKTADERGEMDPARKKFLERRKRWEGPIVEMLREEFDTEVVNINRRYVDGDYNYLAAEIDFEWVDQDGVVQNGEIKTVSPFTWGGKSGWGEPGSGDIPVHYEAQVQHGLGVMNRKKCAVAAMVGLDSMVFYMVERNDDVIFEMRRRAHVFWRDAVLAKKVPDAQTLGDLRGIYSNVTAGVTVEGTGDVALAALRLRGLRGQMAALQMQADADEFMVKQHMKDAEFLTVEGKKIFSWKESDYTILDQQLLKLEHKDVHKACVKRGRRRVFKGMAWTD